MSERLYQLGWGERFIVEAQNYQIRPIGITNEGALIRHLNPSASFGEEYEYELITSPTNEELLALLVALARKVVQGGSDD